MENNMINQPFNLTELIDSGYNFLDGIFNNITNGITITDENSYILYVNQAFSTITGYSKTEAIGNKPGFLHSGKHNKEYYTSMWHSIHNKGYWSNEIWNRHKNGHLLPEWITITKLTGKHKTFYIAIFSDITILVDKTKQTLNLAYTDPLTGLYNRTFIDTIFEINKKASRNLALLFIDLNKFKLLNDTYGHLAGDMGLKYTAEAIKTSIRDTDTAIRFGGDEFLILLDNITSRDKVIEICTRIKEAITQPFEYENNLIYINISIGAALFPTDSDNFNELIKLADKAMYKSKSTHQYLNFYTESI